MERLFFILNPVAGTGRGAKYFPQLRAILDAKGVDYGYARSEHPGHAVELTRQAVAAGEKRIIAVGGDGTVNEVASALYGTGVVMGILPLGTGNDLARTLGLPTEPLEALDVVLNGQVRPMDAGMANDCFFINAAGYGFDVDVLQRVEKYKKRLNGMLPYLLGIAEALFHLRRLKLTLRRPEGITETTGFILVAANGRYLGGGMNATPQADPFDGLLDVCLVKDMPFYKFLPAIARFVKGAHLDLAEVDYFKVQELELSCPAGGPLDLDGELKSQPPVVFRALPGAIPVLLRG